MNAAIVTGASSGIGRAAAQRFVAEGWEVHNLSRRPSGLDGVVDHPADLADLAEVEATGAALVEALGGSRRLALIHNSAVMESDAVDRVDAARFDRALRLNVTAPAVLTAALRPLMAEGSSIVYIGSTLSEQGVPGRLSYVASKHAVVGLMRASCQDLIGTGIHTVCVCPGFTDTEMVRPAYDASPEFRAFIAEKVAFGRLITSEEMAEVVYRAATLPVLNGAVIHANLGQRMS